MKYNLKKYLKNSPETYRKNTKSIHYNSNNFSYWKQLRNKPTTQFSYKQHIVKLGDYSGYFALIISA